MGKDANQRKSDVFARLTTPFCPPRLRELGEELQREHRAIVAFIFVGIVVISSFATLNLKLGNQLAAAIQYVSDATLLAMLLVNRSGRPKLAAHVAVAMTTLTIFIGMWTGGGMSAAALVFVPMLPALGLLSVGKGGGIAGAAQAIGVVMLVATLETLGFEPRHDPPAKLFVKRTAESIAVVMMTWMLCYLFFRLKDEAFAMLARKRDELASLFDGMRQGLLAFGADGRVAGQCSKQAKMIFRRATLEDAEVVELLYRDSPPFDLGREQFVTWLAAIFTVSSGDLSQWMELAPSHSVLASGGPDEQHLRLEFRPIVEHERLRRIMLLVTDETEQVLLKREADAERAAKQRALERMHRLAAGGANTFLATLRVAESRLGGIRETCRASRSGLRVSEIEVMFRAAHTLKGEARLYELDALGALVERLEELLSGLRAQAIADTTFTPEGSLPQIEGLIDEALSAISVVREQLVSASPTGAAILDQVTVRAPDLRALHQQVVRMQAALGEQVAPLSAITSRLLARPFGEHATGLAEAVERWAAQQGKRAVMQLEGKEVAVSPELHEVLPGVLGHLVRNAVAHGIELPDDRLRAGKPECGVVRIRCEPSPTGPRIIVEDDGAGVDVDKLERAAQALGIAWAGAPLELMFVDGLSTAAHVDMLRGRGVGMSAVRADLSAIGYSIESSTHAHGTRFVLAPGEVRRLP